MSYKSIAKTVVVGMFLFSGIKISSAQTSLNVYMEFVGGSTNFSDTVIAPSQTLKGTMIIEVSDTTNISKIHVKLGSTEGGNDFFSQIFNFDVTDSLPSGTTYFREGKVIYLGIGNYTGLNHFFGEAKLENSAGTMGSAITYEQ